MFCPQCGTQMADNATFCRKCGTPMREGATRPVAVATRAEAAHRPAGAAKGQPVIGIVAIIGAALALLGAFLPWIDISGATANGFDGGYLTGGSTMGDGNDGIIIVLLALATAAVAAHYFFGRNNLAAIGVLVLGAAAGLLAAYNMVRLYSDLNDLCSGGGCSAMSSIGMGLYAGVAGGAIAAGAAFFGLRRSAY